MLILYAALKYDDLDPGRGCGFEHYNFYDSLIHMGHDILYFDFGTLIRTLGREKMNQRLMETVRSEKPDLMFTVLHSDELDPDVVSAISQSPTRTVNWFCDDHWRFESLSRPWAPRFNWVVTTAASALPKYERMGYRNVVKSQWACNPFLYRRLEIPLIHDMTFVGQVHGDRAAWISMLHRRGLPVKAWGHGWDQGRLDQQGMIEVFNQSRINLNLSNATAAVPTRRTKVLGGLRTAASHVLNVVPFGSVLKRRLRGNGNAGPSIGASGSYAQQIKGRDFEVPGCGGFLLTGEAEDIGSYYEIGREIVCYRDPEDLIEKARYYLGHEEERLAIARAGHERTLREHTYGHRFNDIFRKMGLACNRAPTGMATARPGSVREIS